MTDGDGRRTPIALVTSLPRLVLPFLQDEALLRRLGVEIAVVVRIRPSMRLLDRTRNLGRVLRRQARINRTHVLAQAVHYFFYRRLSGWARGPDPDSADAALEDGRTVVRVQSANDAAAVDALRDSGAALALVVGADVLTRSTLDAVTLPLYNLHMSDPSFTRGLPIAFWEIHEGRDSMRLTLHELVARLDSGAVVMQRDSPIVWEPTLERTLRRTRRTAGREIARLLEDALPGLLDGTLQPRRVTPGPLRTTPTVRQTLRARRICRQRSAATP